MTRPLILAVCVLFLLPMWFMLTGSLQDIHGVMHMPPRLLPLHPTLANYAYLLRGSAVQWAMNTVVVVIASTLLSVFTSCTAGYAFAFYKFRGSRVLWLALLVGVMVPRISLLIPQFVVMRRLGLSGTLAAVILPAAYAPVSLYLARTYFETVPSSLLESARLDGASEWDVLRYVVGPVSRPIVTAVALFAAIGALQDFVWQSLVLQDESRQTLIVGLMRLAMKRGGGLLDVNPIGRGFAAGVLLLAPLVAVFAVANRYFVGSLGGALKE
jgi:ABC-type glycerol-3-phosphate transport system permease component